MWDEHLGVSKVPKQYAVFVKDIDAFEEYWRLPLRKE